MEIDIPIAEIKNATLAQVEAAVSSIFGMTSSALAQNSLPDAAKLKALRKHSPSQKRRSLFSRIFR